MDREELKDLLRVLSGNNAITVLEAWNKILEEFDRLTEENLLLAVRLKQEPDVEALKEVLRKILEKVYFPSIRTKAYTSISPERYEDMIADILTHFQLKEEE